MTHLLPDWARDFGTDNVTPHEKTIIVLAAIFAGTKRLCTICHENKAQTYDKDDNRICWQCADKECAG
jgi:hypothetical protein